MIPSSSPPLQPPISQYTENLLQVDKPLIPVKHQKPLWITLIVFAVLSVIAIVIVVIFIITKKTESNVSPTTSNADIIPYPIVNNSSILYVSNFSVGSFTPSKIITFSPLESKGGYLLINNGSQSNFVQTDFNNTISISTIVNLESKETISANSFIQPGSTLFNFAGTLTNDNFVYYLNQQVSTGISTATQLSNVDTLDNLKFNDNLYWVTSNTTSMLVGSLILDNQFYNVRLQNSNDGSIETKYSLDGGIPSSINYLSILHSSNTSYISTLFVPKDSSSGIYHVLTNDSGDTTLHVIPNPTVLHESIHHATLSLVSFDLLMVCYSQDVYLYKRDENSLLFSLQDSLTIPYSSAFIEHCAIDPNDQSWFAITTDEKQIIFGKFIEEKFNSSFIFDLNITNITNTTLLNTNGSMNIVLSSSKTTLLLIQSDTTGQISEFAINLETLL